MERLPAYQTLMVPFYEALKQLGGSATSAEITDKVCENLGIPDNLKNLIHKCKKGGHQTEISYRLSWSRLYLKKYGIVDNKKSRTIWTIENNYANSNSEEINEVIKAHRKGE